MTRASSEKTKSNNELNFKRWQQLCHRLDINNHGTICQEFNRLVSAYQESQRAYHTAQHICECLELLDWTTAETGIKFSPVLETALWYHDAVYKPQALDNERCSADQAITFLQAHRVAPKQIKAIESLIMATCHLAGQHCSITSELSQWILDIDLAILGSAPQRFAQYENQIRQEYRWVPKSTYRAERTKVLMQFLERPAIYQSSLFRTRFEVQARHNLSSITLGNNTPVANVGCSN
ncbi:MAG: hypothetical protein F6K11_06680 [Leptolyngbya sp. SIO3F4]|nr:hypothetical protein [Leptolyngbya sp. SIO3F4]